MPFRLAYLLVFFGQIMSLIGAFVVSEIGLLGVVLMFLASEKLNGILHQRMGVQGLNKDNIDAGEEQAVSDDPFFKFVTWAYLPLMATTLFTICWCAAQYFSWPAVILVAIIYGRVNAGAIITGHELVHKTNRFEQLKE